MNLETLLQAAADKRTIAGAVRVAGITRKRAYTALYGAPVHIAQGRGNEDIPDPFAVLPDRDRGTRAESLPIQACPRYPVDLEVVIPAFNEAKRIRQTLIQTLDFLQTQPWTSRVVVVDNGSEDATASVAAECGDHASDKVELFLDHCPRKGKGAAVRKGLLGGTSKFTGFFDADLATPVETLWLAMAHLQQGAAAVIGSRHAPGATYVRPQQLGRRVGGMAFRAMTKPLVRGVCDTQCGFKFFERQTLTRAFVQCRSSGFAFDVELLHLIQDEGSHIVELPVRWTDGQQSTFRPIRDGVESFASIFAMHRVQ